MIDTRLLRQKILDLAIRGKLVPQDPKDEPASELLKKIKVEKEALIKAGKMKRDKHESFIFRGDDKRYYEQVDGKTTDITKKIPFELPKGWAWCRLCSLGIFSGGKTPSMNNKAFWNGDILWVTSKDMKTKYVSDTGLKVSEKGAAELQILSPGALLIVVRSGILRHTLPVAINRKPCTINQDLKAISLYLSVMQEYIYNAIVALEERILADYKKTGTTVESIIWDKFTQIMLPLPPLAEQERIIAQIESLLRCVDEIDRESATLEKSLVLAKQKILDLAIRGKLVPQDPKDEPASELLKKIKAEKEALIKAGKLKREKHESFIFRGDDNCYHENIDGKNIDIKDEIPFDLPDGWVWCRLGHFCQAKGGKRIPKGEKLLDSPTSHVYLRVTDMKDGSICDKGNKYISESVFQEISNYTISKDDLYLTIAGTIGLVGFIPAKFDGMNLTENAAKLTNIKIHKPFLGKILTARYFQDIFTAKRTQVAQPKLALERIISILFPLPPLAEQKRIVSQIEKLFSLLETMRV